MRGTFALVALAAFAFAQAAAAQDHPHEGHGIEAAAPTPAPTPGPQMAVDPDCPPEHAAMGHCVPKAMPAEPEPPAAGEVSAPAAPRANYADRIWGAEAMAASRAELKKHHGGGSSSQVMVDIAEVALRSGRETYRWDAEGWFGGDVDRLVVKTEGEGAFGDAFEGGEVQALYSRAIDPYFNLQAGLRQDIGPGPSRSFVSLGIEGLAPYWFDVEGQLFLSDRGDLLARLGGYYDLRITQRLVLQPRAEVNLAAQNMAPEGIGSGLVDAELGLRLRYEVVREVAPYLGISWERQFGRTARLTRARGDGTGGFTFVAGLRTWF
ncbi:MAG: copper resistance protein B [Novosphingobium sp.]|nr:MAG: copper resistance protein B [Novosphingobium sp.]